MDPTGQGEILRVVVPWDAALLWPSEVNEREDAWRAYNAERDFTALKIKEGARAEVFTTRRLRASEMADVDGVYGASAQARVAFAVGVKEVLSPTGETHRPASGRWTDDEMERFGYAAQVDVGTVIVRRSRLPLGLRVSYVLPPSSVAASVAYHFPYVAQSRTAADPSKSAPAEASGP